jgi:CPA1 family monovalent cation:H+ antiporter
MLWSTTWLNNLLASMSSGAAAMMPSGSGVQSVEALFLLLLLFVALFAGLARRLRVPYPILLVIAGLVLSFLPGMPRVDLNPDVVFLVFLPPLLYAAAWTLSWREFQRNFSSIAMLAIDLVLFTIVGLAIVAGRLLPGFDWRSAVLLGAVVAATDAIGATSIARRVGLPQQIVDILEAESLKPLLTSVAGDQKIGTSLQCSAS